MEEVDEELMAFAQLFPGLEQDEIREILEVLAMNLDDMEEEEREPDGIDNARNAAFAKLNTKNIDIDD